MSLRGVSTRSPGQRGISLVEVLVVVALLGIIASIGILQFSNYWQRSRLESAAGELRAFLGGASMQTRQDSPTLVIRPVWVRLDAAARTVTVAADSGFADVLAQHRLPDFLRVTADWVVSGGATGPWTVQCDAQGRAVHPVNGDMVGGPQVVTVTHQNMVTGRLRPHIRYHIQVAPLWNATSRREVL